MKLEEVLPAMREGRTATWRGTSYWLDGDVLKFCLDGLWEPSSQSVSLMLDGWTLEPEPKVEWPKGSIQKALESRQPGTEARIFRKAWLHTITLSEVNINNIMPNDLLALDWEVVP